jgi:uncharacterized protein (DUF302 family)
MSDPPGITERVVIERSSISTGKPYEIATAAFENDIGRLEPETARALIARQASWAEVEAEMGRMAGSSGLMLFAKFDQGAVASLSGTNTRCAQYLVGNPAIAARIVRIELRVSLYVPFHVALFEHENGGEAILSYDRPSSFLGQFEQPELREIGLMLDAQIDSVARRLTGGFPA